MTVVDAAISSMPFFRRKTEKTQKSVTTNSPPPVELVQGGSGQSSSNTSPTDLQGADLGKDTSPYGWGERPRTLLLQPGNYSEVDGATSCWNRDGLKIQTPVLTSSRLSKTLHEICHDKDALPYFIQYMNSREAEHIIKFWLDAESFQASSWTRIRSQSTRNSSRRSRSPKQSPEDAPSEDEARRRVADGHDTVDSGQPRHSALPKSESCASNASQVSSNASGIATCASSDAGSMHEDIPVGGCACAGPTTDSTSASGTGCGTDASSVHTGSGGVRSSIQPDCQPSSSTHTDTITPPGVDSACGSGHSVTSSGSHTNQPADTGTSHKSRHNSAQDEQAMQDKLRKSIERDAVSIYQKYISQDATHPIGITDELRNETISKICREDGQVDPQCFVPCQSYVLDLMDNNYFQGFLQSEFHCKHQIDILTGKAVHLADVLYNESALFYFMEFMEQEGAIDLLQCWLAIDNFQQLLSERHGTYDGMEAQTDAMVIYEKYFSLQATRPLGFDDKVRFEVECNICRESGPLPDCFATPKRQVLRTIEKVHFPPFIKSDLYFKYLSELINTIQTASEFPSIKPRKRTGSDASSEHSLGNQSTGSEHVTISAKNTLLAAADGTTVNNVLIKKAFGKVSDNMRIDNTLFNPDALWLRPQTGSHMTLGRVNEVGEFISELDPEPDHDKKRAKPVFFKKNKEKEKTQEEMALQIAQMILADVNQATQGAEGAAAAPPSLLGGMPGLSDNMPT